MVKILSNGFYIVVIGILFSIHFSQAQEDKQCKLNGSSGRVVTVRIDDLNFKQGQFDVENVKSIGIITNSEHYTLSFDQVNNLIIWKFIDDSITDFDESFDKTTTSPYTEEMNAELTCSDGSNNAYIIRIFITDTNDHDPTIVKQEYIFTVPNPLPANLDITLLDGNELIQVEDKDFSVQDIIVDITNTDLQFITKATQVGNSKRYTISLKFEKQTWLKSDANFQIVANNEGRLSDPTTIQLNIDQNNSAPDPPTFIGSKKNCECSYNEANPLETTCDLLEVRSNTAAEYDVTTDADGILDVSLDSSNKITITLKGPIDANKNAMIYNLKVSKKSNPNDASELPIIIQVPKF